MAGCTEVRLSNDQIAVFVASRSKQSMKNQKEKKEFGKSVRSNKEKTDFILGLLDLEVK